MKTPDELLVGALDTHAHGSPEFSTAMPGRLPNDDWARAAQAAGLRGLVVKSHVFPTMGIAASMAAAAPGLEVYSGITLNPTVGGISALAVELAAEAGARVVWMPTWSARQDPPRPSAMLTRMGARVEALRTVDWPAEGLAVTNEPGVLTEAAEAVLAVCATRGLTLATGHLPIADSLVLCERAAGLGIRTVLTHPLSAAVGASVDDQRRVAELGGFVEHVFLGCMPMHQRMDPQVIATAIEAVGAEHCVMATDAIEAWNPPQPELLRMFVASMLHLGIGEDDIHLMTHENPARALGLPEVTPGEVPGPAGS